MNNGKLTDRVVDIFVLFSFITAFILIITVLWMIGMIIIDTGRLDEHCKQYESVLMRDIETVEIGCISHLGIDQFYIQGDENE